MVLGETSPGPGWTGLSVKTVLTNPSTRPGLTLEGRVIVAAGGTDVPVGHVVLGLLSRVEPDDPEADRLLLEFHRVRVAGAFVVPAGLRRVLPFAAPVPWETPVTVLSGQLLLSLRMGLRTELELDPMLDQGDLVPVYVYPLPAQEQILATLDTLGFQLRQAGLQPERLPGVNQALPLHQKIGFWAAPLYAGPFTELELTFITDPEGVEVIFWLDRRKALAGAGHFSLSRFRVQHASVARTDWAALVDAWLRHAINRHADAASGYRGAEPITEAPHVSRPPDDPDPSDEDSEGTAGSSGTGGGGAGGGGDGT
jgi:sporulation-control protein spo0M